MKGWKWMAAGLALSGLSAACGPTHIAPYEPKKREYTMPVALDMSETTATPGSLWSPARPAKDLFRDQRALRMGDLVVVRVAEHADARRGATTELSRQGELAAKLSAFLGLIGEKKIEAGLGTSYKGTGQTSRTERLEATVSAMVKAELPNGNLFIEGHRVVLVNHEEHHFYISGVIRPYDVAPDNSIASALIADAEIEFTGRGVISEKQQPGHLLRGMDYGSPL